VVGGVEILAQLGHLHASAAATAAAVLALLVVMAYWILRT